MEFFHERFGQMVTSIRVVNLICQVFKCVMMCYLVIIKWVYKMEKLKESVRHSKRSLSQTNQLKEGIGFDQKIKVRFMKNHEL